MKNKKVIIILFAIILIAQLVTKIYVDCKKSDFFIDEFYSYALMNYKVPFIFQEETFLNNWHDSNYFKDYLSIQKDEVFNLSPVYTNQVADVHPPFYYLLLRIFSTFFIGIFSKWPGLILNLIIYIFSAIIFFKIAQKILKNDWYALVALFTYGFSVFSMENTLYIRMYQLLELHLLLITYWHLKNYDKSINLRNYITLTVLVTLGFLTHYYYILFFVGLYLIYMFNYVKHKQIKSLLKYNCALLIAIALILIIFPHCLTHIFFSYRGSDSLSNLFNNTHLLIFIKIYFQLIGIHIFFYGFSILFGVLLLLKATTLIRSSIKNRQFKLNIKKEVIFISIPTIIYLCFVIVTSPFVNIRYISPILVFILLFTIYFLKDILYTLINKKNISFIITTFLLIALTAPTLFFNNRLLYIYADKKAFYENLKENYGSLPCIYIYIPASEMSNNFVYDYNFLLQSNNVYITESISPDTIQDIFKSMDTSNGFLIYAKMNNLPNILRIIESSEFNSYKVIGESYNSSIIYVYYDENYSDDYID